MPDNVITEIGFSINHEHSAGRLVKSLKNTTVRVWVGDAVDTNLIYLPDEEGGYREIKLEGKTYSNAKIIKHETDISDGQLYYIYEIEQRVDPLDCKILGEVLNAEAESFSHTVSTSRDSDSVSYTRTFSLQMVDYDNYIAIDGSPTGTGLIDKAVSEINKAFKTAPKGFTSVDEDINDVIKNAAEPCDNDDEGRYNKVRSERIDKVKCSVEISETVTKRINENDCCIESQTISLSWAETGMVNISINGSIKGGCENFKGCDENRQVTKTKYDYALECFDEEGIRQKIIDEYEKHRLEECEIDVCLALRINSSSVTHCYQDGTINYSFNAQEEEVLEKDNSANVYIYDNVNKDGCISTINREFDITAPINNSFIEKNPDYLVGDCSHVEPTNTAEEAIELCREALKQISKDKKLDAGEGFFGPINLTINECPSRGSIVGTVVFSNDPKFDILPSETFVKKKIRETTTCATEIRDNRYSSPCSCPIIQTQVMRPGSIQECLEVLAYPCATLGDLRKSLDMEVPEGAIVSDSNSSFSVNAGSLTANSCVTYHTQEQLNQCS
jgi:hypothetical protein